jgi:hypothetical protein
MIDLVIVEQCKPVNKIGITKYRWPVELPVGHAAGDAAGDRRQHLRPCVRPS